jgi:hypothetical protein
LTKIPVYKSLNKEAIVEHLFQLIDLFGKEYAWKRAKQIAAMDEYWSDVPELLVTKVKAGQAGTTDCAKTTAGLSTDGLNQG